MKRTIALITLLAITGVAAAETMTFSAEGVATVQPGGIRTGDSGTDYWNAQGSDNGTYASYAVTRFDLSGLVCPDGLDLVIDSVTLRIVQSNSWFTADGSVNLNISDDDTTSLLPHAGEPTYPDAWGTESTVTTYDFTHDHGASFNGSGKVETYDITTSAVLGEMADDSLTIVLRENDETVSATYAGTTNSWYDEPQLIVDYHCVPEPLSMGMGLVGLVGGFIVRRRFA